MKHLPNVISALRIMLSISFLFIKPFSTLFFIVYFCAGFSDFIDGFLARKLSLTSEFGATLDSIADFTMVLTLAIALWSVLHLTAWLVGCIFFIFAIRLLSLLVGYKKFSQIAFLHTYLNKIAGLTLFLSPLVYLFLGLTKTAVIVSSIATIAALEELSIQTITKTLNKNITSLFQFKQKR